MLILSTLLVCAVLYSVLQTESFYKDVLIPKLSSALGLRIEVNRVQVNPVSFISIEGLAITTSDEKRHTLQSFSLKYNLLPLLWGILRFESIGIGSADVRLDSFLSPESETAEPVDQIDRKSSESSGSIVMPWYLSHLEVGEVLMRDCDVEAIPGLGEQGFSISDLNLRIAGYRTDVKFPWSLEFEFNAPAGNGVVPEHAVLGFDSEWAFTPSESQVLGHASLSISGVQGDAATVRADGKELDIRSDVRFAGGMLRFEDIVIGVQSGEDKLVASKGGVNWDLNDGSLSYNMHVLGISDDTMDFLGAEDLPVTDLDVDLTLKGELGATGFEGNHVLAVKTLQYGNTWVSGHVMEGSSVELAVNSSPDGVLKFGLEVDALREKSPVTNVSAKATYAEQRLNVNGNLSLAAPSLIDLVASDIPWISGNIAGSIDLSLISGDVERFEGEFRLDDVVSSLPYEPLSGKLVAMVAGAKGGGHKGKLSLDLKNPIVGDVLNLSFDGGLATSEVRPSLTGNLHVPLLHVENVLALVPRSQQETKKEQSKLRSSNSADVESFPGPGVLPFDLGIDLDFQGWSIGTAKLKSLQGELGVTPVLYELRGLRVNFNDSEMEGDIRIPGDFSIDNLLLDFEAKNIELSEIVGVIDPRVGRDISGRVKRVKATTQESSSGSKGRDRVHVVSIGAAFESLQIPAYLQETPPINLLFLPLDALNATIGTLGSVVLPGELVEVVSSVNGSFKELGRIGFDEARIRLRIDSQGLRVEDTIFNGAIIPTLTFSGEVGVDGALEMVIGIEILKVPVPLTVGGTLGIPLPNLVSFPYEVARSIGLGIANIADLVVDSDDDEALVPEEDA